LALLVVAAVPSRSLVAQGRAGGAPPTYQAELLWPKPLPNHWVLGAITGVAIDGQDHIWIAQRGADSLTVGTEAALGLTPVGAEYCCSAAPFVLEFDSAGTLLAHWGGPGTGFDWPQSPGGIAIDNKGNLWMAAMGPPEPAAAGRNATGGGGAPAGGGARAAGAAGAGAAATPPAGARAAGAGGGGGGGRAGAAPRPADAHVLKFSSTGQFILQIGHAGQVSDKDGTTGLDHPAAVAIDSAANELYVADGGAAQRVVVFDARTGAFKRQWRGHDSDFTRLSGISISKDGMVYVSDRKNNRVQVFKKDGTFVSEVVISAATTGNGSTWGVGLSSDAKQQFLFIPDGQDEKIWVLDRATLKTVTTFGDGGRQPGEFYAVNTVVMDSKGVVYTGEGYEGKRLQRWVKK
jgi:hypothetical protein